MAAAAVPPAPSPAADATTGGEQQLGQVTVEGTRLKATRSAQKIVDWLKRLVGPFRYEGSVELGGEGASRQALPVSGVADCTAFGRASGVSCTMMVTWPEVHGENGAQVPGGVSTLAPAIIQYGLDPDHIGIRYLQVDNKGLANYGQGYLVGDTLTTTTPCVGIEGECRRITTIDAHPDGNTTEMRIDIEQDFVRTVRFSFVLHRLSPGQFRRGGGTSR